MSADLEKPILEVSASRILGKSFNMPSNSNSKVSDSNQISRNRSSLRLLKRKSSYISGHRTGSRELSSLFSKKKYKIRKATIVCLTGLSACGTFFMGYNMGVFDTMEEHVGELFKWTGKERDIYLTLITTFLSVGALLGSFLSGFLTNILGRKNTLITIDLLAIVGCLLTLIENPYFIMVGRLITGLGLGAFTSVSRLYMSEMSPIHVKPMTMAIIDVFEMLGVQVAYLLGLGFSNPRLAESSSWWRLMFGMNIAICGLHFLVTLIFFNFETPIFVYIKQKDKDKVRKVLRRIYLMDEEVEKALEDLEEIVEEKIEQNNITFLQLFNKKYRNRTLVGIYLSISAIFVGCDSLIFYSNSIFMEYSSPKRSTAYTNIIEFSQLLASIITVSFIEHQGRKKLLLIGTSSIFFILFTLGIIYLNQIYSPLIYLFILYIMLNGTTVAPVTNLYISDILPEKGLALCYMFFYTATIILTSTFKFIKNSPIGLTGVFWIYGAFTLMSFFFIMFRVKESRGKTLAQLEKLLY